ncbi:MAG: NCS2 family permease [Eubacteriales bacterium]
MNEMEKQGFLEKTFKLKEKGGTVNRELIAAFTTFATMSYVLAVQPSAIIGFTEATFTDINGLVLTKEAVMIMCALVSGLITILMGLYANLPFALSTGMGTNFMFGAMIQTGAISFAGAMTITLVSGIVFVILTACGVRDLIVTMIPKNLKIGIGISVGFYIAYLGFSNSGIGSFVSGISMGDYGDVSIILALVGLFLIAALEVRKVPGGILIGVLVVTILGLFVPTVDQSSTVTNIPVLVSVPNLSDVGNLVFQFDFASLLTWAAIPLIFISFCGDFFCTLGTILGVAGSVNMLDEDGNLPEINKPFMVDAIGTTVGSAFGCTTITTFVESASGVAAGARTGLSSIVVGILFLASTFFAPLFTSIPNCATGPALIYIGFMMMGSFKDLDFSDYTEYFGVFVMIMFTAFAGGLAVGISMGILAHIFIKVVTGQGKDIHVGMYILSIPLIFYFVANGLM